MEDPSAPGKHYGVHFSPPSSQHALRQGIDEFGHGCGAKANTAA